MDGSADAAPLPVPAPVPAPAPAPVPVDAGPSAGCDQRACDRTARDGCCPGTCNANNDSDCSPRCGNGVVEAGELCDRNCPESCSNQGCTARMLDGSGCTVRCLNAGVLDNGASCGGENVCLDGECRPCPSTGSCVGNSNPCQDGVNRCTAGKYSCENGGNKPGGTPCEGDRSCDGNGDCIARLVINEISSDPNPDWIEFYNPNRVAVDLSGWSFSDANGGPGHRYSFPAGTTVPAGGLIVRDENVHFPFGLASADSVILRDANGQLADQYSWTAHVSTHGRCPDGSGPFSAMTPTKGSANRCP